MTGAAALIASGGFGTPALRPVGVGLIALGLGAIVGVEAMAKGIRVARLVDRETLRPGDRAVVTVRVRGWPARNRALALMDWDIRSGVPDVATVEPRRATFIHGEIRQETVIHALPRGRHQFAAPGVTLGDPFGLARVRRAARTDHTILVLAHTVPVLVPFWESGAARRAGQHAGLLRGRSELGGVRDYEAGDPLSLIHWAQTARRGRLQTKELHGESGRGATLTVLLDAVASPANGSGADAPFELAVMSAASLVGVCAPRGDSVGLIHTGAQPINLPLGSDPGHIERELATVQADGTQQASLGVRAAIGAAVAPRMLVVITAVGDRGLAAAASSARSAGINVATVLIGDARAYAGPLRRAGAWVAEVADASDLTAALDGSRSYARGA